MRYALVDNSTLTAAQRLFGSIPVVNSYEIDGDIVAFEGFIQGILFYDRVFYVDDYKEEYSAERKKMFPFLVPLQPSSISYDDLVELARKATDDVLVKVHGGTICDDDFADFFKMLDMHLTMTWDMQSSDYFLTLKMLRRGPQDDMEKYNGLSSMIFSQLGSKTGCTLSSTPAYDLVGSDGQPIYNQEKVRPQVKAFMASLSWLALRTAFYTLLSVRCNIETILHPIRSSFQVRFAKSRLNVDSSVFQPVIRRLTSEVAESLTRIRGASEPALLDVKLPFFTAWLAHKTRDPAHFLEAAFELRDRPEFIQARTRFVELEELLEAGNHSEFVKNVNRLVSEIEKLCSDLCEIYGVTTRQGVPVGWIAKLTNVALAAKGIAMQLPEIDVNLPMPEAVVKYRNRRAFKGLFRSLVNDLTNVARLGEYHEIISSAVLRDSRFGRYPLKVEEQRFLGRSSHWKRPM